MDYISLVNSILAKEVLLEAVNSLSSRVESLNLVTPEWKTILENSKVYETHSNRKAKYLKGRLVAKEKAYNKRLKNPNDFYNIIVAGEWSLSKSEDNDYSIVSRSCEPLQFIANSMKETSDSNLHDGGRFFIRECTVQFCDDCKQNHEKFQVPFVTKNWCVKSLRIFNGNNIMHSFAYVLQKMLSKMGSFFGILRMQITSRTTFGDDCYKIGGTIEELIVFQHTVLLPFDLKLGDSHMLPYCTGNTYTVEEEEEEEEGTSKIEEEKLPEIQ